MQEESTTGAGPWSDLLGNHSEVQRVKPKPSVWRERDVSLHPRMATAGKPKTLNMCPQARPGRGSKMPLTLKLQQLPLDMIN